MTTTTTTLEIRNIPLSVFNRALELYGEEPVEASQFTFPVTDEEVREHASLALMSAASRIDTRGTLTTLTPFEAALIEHIREEGYCAG